MRRFLYGFLSLILVSFFPALSTWLLTVLG